MEDVLELAADRFALILDHLSHQGHVEQASIRFFRTVCGSALGNQPGYKNCQYYSFNNSYPELITTD